MTATVTFFDCAAYLRHRGFLIDGETEIRTSPKITVHDIQATVAEYFGVRPAEMTSDRRSREVARPRQIAMYLSKQLTAQSLPQIGKRFRRDHTTVIHAIRQVGRLQLEDAEFARDVDWLSAHIAGGSPL